MAESFGNIAVAITLESEQAAADIARFAGKVTGALAGIDRATSNWSDGLRRAAGFTHQLGAIGGAVSGVAGSILGAARETSDYADNLLALSERLGVSAEELQEFRFAAEQLANIEPQAFDQALEEFARRPAEAKEGAGELASAMPSLVGSTEPLSERLRHVADAMQAATPDRRQTLAFAAFGQAGQELIPMLEGGRDAMAKEAAEARRLGTVLSTESAQGARTLGGTMDQVAG